MNRDVIRKIWSRELELDDFSDDDDFFALGGHSLIMAKIQHAIGEELGIEVPMDELFRHSTVNSIAAHLAAQPATA
ncbi:acyl carrier protein [Geodermatophilus sp. URMC 62]|uniref:acyl carrier protein n=1 Tax=Geodermatophilus sp. URMC 62 TaxID=3423414 RepID=UPI00406CF691